MGAMDQEQGAGPHTPFVQECVTAHISSTDTKSTLGGLQAHTTYRIEISDFGRSLTVDRRYDDFNNLHCELIRICGESNLPPMPKKQFFGSLDSDTVEKRKPQLGLILQTMLKFPEALIEKQNLLWNFLELPVASIACTRFLQAQGDLKVPYLKQLVKIATEDKYVEDRYRLYYPIVMKELLTVLSAPDASEDVLVNGMEVLKAILKVSGKAREVFFDLRGLHVAFTIAASKPSSLEHSRGVFNSIIIGSGDMFPTGLCMFLDTGLQLLRDLLTPEVDDHFSPFLAKILWIAWEPVAIQKLITPAGLPLLSQLFQSGSVVGRAYIAIMLATALVHGAFDPTSGERAAAGIDGFVVEMLNNPPSQSKLVNLETITRTRSSLNRLLPCLQGTETSARLALWIMARVPPKDGFLTADLFRQVKNWAVCQADHTTRSLASRILLHISTKGDPNGSVPWFADPTSFNASRSLLADFLSSEVYRTEKEQHDTVQRYNLQKARDQRAPVMPTLDEYFDSFHTAFKSYQHSRSKVAESLSMSENLLKKYDTEIIKTKEKDLPPSIDRNPIEQLDNHMHEFQSINQLWEEQHKVEKAALEKVHEAVTGKNEADEIVRKGDEKLAKLRKDIDTIEEKRQSIIKELQELRIKAEEEKMSGTSDAASEETLKEKEALEQKLNEQKAKWREQERTIEDTMQEERKKWQAMSEVQVVANTKLQQCQQQLDEISKRKRAHQAVIEEKVKPVYTNILNCHTSIQKCEEHGEESAKLLTENWGLFFQERDERINFLQKLNNLKEILAQVEQSLYAVDDSELQNGQ